MSGELRETLAMALFAKWSIEGCGFPDKDWEEPEWAAYKAGEELNPVHLTKEDFLGEADWLLDMIKPHLGKDDSLTEVVPDTPKSLLYSRET